MADNKTTTPQGLRVLAIVCHNPIMPDVLTLRIVVTSSIGRKGSCFNSDGTQGLADST